MVYLSEIISFFKQRKLTVVESSVDLKTTIKGGRNIFEAGPGEITFLSSKLKDDAEKLLSVSKSPLIVIDNKLWSDIKVKKTNSFIVISDTPKNEMVECLKQFFVVKISAGIHATALIDKDAKLGNNNYVGPYTVIENNVEIGNNCVIESHVNIKSSCRIGNNVLIKSGTVIGGKGFGYVKNEKNVWENFPHFGSVIIEDNVEIGSNTCIDRGALGDTILRKGVKVDNLVHVAHNVVVGEDSLLIADSMIGGSTVIGKNTWIAPSTALRNGISIGSDCIIGMGAVVTKSVGNGITVVGNPAVPFNKKEKN
jgi:UDP-3-O-[3-hydroxymyristoyl] glucosamine N-acyltransferase